MSGLLPALRPVDYRPTPSRRHDYQVRLPPGWCAVQVPHDPPDGLLARCLGWFVTDDDREVSLEIRCVRTSHEIDPLDLLELHLERDGATVLERAQERRTPCHAGALLVRRAMPGGEALTLARVEKDAELLYLVLAHTTVAGFAAREALLREVVSSFRLLRPRGGLAEPLLPAGARFPMDHCFLFPSSFALVTDPTADGALAAYELTHGRRGGAAGTIAILVLPRRSTDHESAEAIAAWCRGAFERQGVDLGPITLDEVAPLAQTLPTRGGQGVGRRAGRPAETELCVARHDQAWIVLARATPRRVDDGALWCASRRAFALVRERFTVRPRHEP